MSYVRIISGPDGETLMDNRSPERIEDDRLRLAALQRSVAAILHPLQSNEERVQKIQALRTIHGLFVAITNGDGQKHEVDGTANLNIDEKRFLVYAASRSNALFMALTLGRWSEVVSLLAASKALHEREVLRVNVVLKLAQLDNGTEDRLVTQVATTSSNTTLAA